MSNLSANSFLVFENGDTNSLPIKASTEIWAGSCVGLTSGYARMLTAGDVFGGFAEAHVNNTVATDGANTIPVRQRGLVQLSVTSVAVTDIGKPVYASDGNTYTLTQSTNTRVGTVYRFISSGVCIVKFDALKSSALGGLTALTDSSGGASADGTIGAIGTFTPSVAWNGSSVYPSAADATSINTRIVALTDAIKELSTKVNSIIAA